MKELRLEELTLEQKIGMTLIGYVSWDGGSNVDYLVELVKRRALGAVWVVPKFKNSRENLKRIKEAADYPLLVFTDAESGFGEYLIGRHNAIACTGSEELAYTFGKVTGIGARNAGYNVVCNPILDMINNRGVCGGNIRSLGADKYQVTKLASAVARGMHDAGVLTVGKHYPGGGGREKAIDTHMAEGSSTLTREELVDYNLYPYVKLNEAGLLDGIMTTHAKFHNIDPDYPASLSSKVIGIIRELGFDGIALTDALVMHGIVAKFGKEKPVAMCIGAGNDLSLPFVPENEKMYENTMKGYREGLISEERLNEAVRRVLDAQHKVFVSRPEFTEITEEDKAEFDRINRDSVYLRVDEGTPKALDKNGKYFFAVLVEQGMDTDDRERVDVDTFTSPWYDPFRIKDKIGQLFPNSVVGFIHQYPTGTENMRILNDSLGLETVFVTSFPVSAYVGTERFTSRIISLLNAMQVSDRISTIVHFGNPYLLEEAPHVPRVLIGTTSAKGIDYTFDVLAGDIEARGVLTYDVHFTEKGNNVHERLAARK